MDVIEFAIPGRSPAALSPNSRVHWRQKHADGTVYGETVYLLAQSAKPASWPSQGATRAIVTLTQYAVRLRDHDNLATSFKSGLDALTKARIILDDKPSVIDLVLKAEKVQHEADERVVVRIERIP